MHAVLMIRLHIHQLSIFNISPLLLDTYYRNNPIVSKELPWLPQAVGQICGRLCGPL